jgi:signal transduction histidine kinase/ligand-binding sensor domain-containing protein
MDWTKSGVGGPDRSESRQLRPVDKLLLRVAAHLLFRVTGGCRAYVALSARAQSRDTFSRFPMLAAFAHFLLRFLSACLFASLVSTAQSALAIDLSLTLVQLHHTAWSTRDGAPAQVESLAQTDDGTLWLGSPTGLFCFDGLQFERFQPPIGEGGPTASVATLFAPPGHGLWIGYRFGGVGWWNQGHLRHFGRAEGLPSGTVTAVTIDAQGRAWLGTTTGLARFDGHHWSTPPEAAGYPTGATYALHTDRAGTVWAVAEDGTWRLPRDGVRFVRSTRSISFAWLAERSDGRVWESNGTQGVWTLPDVDASPPLKSPVPGPGHVGPLLFDRDGAMWVASQGGVARLVDPDRLSLAPGGDPQVEPSQRFTHADGLSGDQVLALLEDREGDLWLSTSGGIDRFRANKLTRTELPAGLLSPSLAAAPGEGVWVGSTDVAPARLGRDERRLAGVGPRITSVLRDTRGGVWMAGARGVWRIADDAARRVDLPSNLGGTPVQAMADMGGGRLRLAILRHGQWEQDVAPSTGWHPVPEPPGGPDANPLAMARDPRGRLWLGYAFNRLVRVDTDGTLASWGAQQGLHVGSLLALCPQGDRLWLGGELGLALVVDGRIHAISVVGEEALVGVSGIVVDPFGDVWANTALGIFRLPAAEIELVLREPSHAVVAERMDYHDGLDGAPAQLRPVPTAVVADDGVLWFATNNSVVWIDPRHVRRNPVAPPARIVALDAGGNTWPLQAPTLPVGTRSVDLRYTAVALAQPERVTFRVRLDGVDSDWQDVDTRRSVHYTNLAPGHYVFHVLARNEDGIWGARPAMLAFSVPPAFQQTWWFRLMWVPIAGLLAWALVRSRLRRLAARYADRHEAMLIERERIARELHDTLLQSVQGLILRFQSGVDRMPQDDPSRLALERSLDRAEEVLMEGRDRVNELRTPAGSGATLGESLARFGEELSAEHGHAFSAALRGEGQPLSGRIRHEAEHIGREALLNAAQHGRSAEIRLIVQQTPTRLMLEVRDDGRGMPTQREYAAGRAGHWGLAGMRERARSIGARFTLTSAEGEGTSIRLELRLRGRARRGWLGLMFNASPLAREQK